MKYYFLVLAVVVSVVAASCKRKCAECHYDLNGAEVDIGEFCDAELLLIESKGFEVDDTTTYEVHCHEH